MEKFEAPKNKEELNKFSSEKTLDLLEILERLKTKSDELKESLDDYGFEDRVNLENDYEQTLRDMKAVEEEIERRSVNN